VLGPRVPQTEPPSPPRGIDTLGARGLEDAPGPCRLVSESNRARHDPVRLPRPWERDAEDQFLDASILLPDLETMDIDDDPDGAAARARRDR
jgi:hypothetical protein